MKMEKYEIYWIDNDGDEYYTGDWFYDYNTALEVCNTLNETEERPFIIKKIKVKRYRQIQYYSL